MATAIRAGRAYVELGIGDKMSRGLRQAEARLKAFGSAITSIGRNLTILGGVALAPLLASVKTFTSMGDALEKMSRRTGFAVDSLSILGFAAAKSGTNLNELEIGIRSMARQLLQAGRGSQRSIDAFNQLGLSIAALDKMSPEEKFFAIGEGISRIEDPTRRAALAQTIFGESGSRLLPLLEQGAAGFALFRREAERLGIVMSGPEAKEAAALADRFAVLGAQARRAAFVLGKGLAPVFEVLFKNITPLAKRIIEFIDANAFAAKIALVSAAAMMALGSAALFVGLTIKSLKVLGVVATVIGTATLALKLLTGSVILLGKALWLIPGLFVAAIKATAALGASTAVLVKDTVSLTKAMVISAIKTAALAIKTAALTTASLAAAGAMKLWAGAIASATAAKIALASAGAALVGIMKASVLAVGALNAAYLSLAMAYWVVKSATLSMIAALSAGIVGMHKFRAALVLLNIAWGVHGGMQTVVIALTKAVSAAMIVFRGVMYSVGAAILSVIAATRGFVIGLWMTTKAIAVSTVALRAATIGVLAYTKALIAAMIVKKAMIGKYLVAIGIVAAFAAAMVALATQFQSAMKAMGSALGAFSGLFGKVATYLTQVWGVASDWVVERFWAVYDEVSRVLGAIVAAISAGEIGLAWEVTMAYALLVVERAVGAIIRVWHQFKAFVVKTFWGVVYNFVAAWTYFQFKLETGIHWISKTFGNLWHGTIDMFKNLWSGAAVFWKKTWSNLFGWAKKLWAGFQRTMRLITQEKYETIVAEINEATEEETAKADKRYIDTINDRTNKREKANLEREEEYQALLAEGQAERDSKLAAIVAGHDDKLIAFDKAQEGRESGREAQLSAAQSRLDEVLNRVDDVREEQEKGMEFPEFDAMLDEIRAAMEGFDASVSQDDPEETKTPDTLTRGAFNLARTIGLQTSNVDTEQLKELQRIRRIVGELDNGGRVLR